MILDNKPDAAGNLGADAVARAPADGYTLLLFVNSYTIDTSVYKNLGWDLTKDFAPVGPYGSSPMAVVVNAGLPVKDVRELIACARSHPGQLNDGSAGIATAPHPAVEWFATLTGVQATHVPYRGSAPSGVGLLEPAYPDPKQSAELIRKDVARWREVAERIKLKLD